MNILLADVGDRYMDSDMIRWMGSGMMGFGSLMGWTGWIFMVLFWMLIIIGIIVLVKMVGKSRSKSNRNQR
jgi:putative membrane protein